MVSSDVTSLDLATKVRLLTGASFFTLHGEESIGLLPMSFSDGPTGVRGLDFTGGPLTCLFPNATLLASSWDRDVLREVGRLLAEEAYRQQIHVVLGPTVNLHRVRLGGRLFEAYSEDPLLTGHLAAAYVAGLQVAGHRRLREAPGRQRVRDRPAHRRQRRGRADAARGLPAAVRDRGRGHRPVVGDGGLQRRQRHRRRPSSDPVNNEILKDEWGWDGLVMSDWFATQDAPRPAANGGLDLVMPGPVGPWGDALVAAVERGEVDEAVLDDQLRRLLLLAERVSAPLDEPPDVAPTCRLRTATERRSS